MKNIKDYDLDLMNLLKDFPEDEENCFMYLRHQKKDGSFIMTRGDNHLLVQSLLSSMMDVKGFDEIVLSSVVNYLHTKCRIDDFIKDLNHAKNIKDE